MQGYNAWLMGARFDVRKVAQLACLGLTESEEERLRREFEAILEFVAKVQALPLEGVPASVHSVAPPLPWEADEPRPGLHTEQALAGAPDRIAEFFKVPPILAHAAAPRRPEEAETRE